MTEPIILYFDLISPYAYLAWKTANRLAERSGRRVHPVPVLFAAMLDHYGHKGPAEIPPKRLYTFRHVSRLAAAEGLRVQPPPSHPFNPLLGLRLASLPLGPERREPLIHALFDAVWGGGGGVETPEAVRAALRATGEDAEALTARAVAPENKARLREQTEAAIAFGAFGVPTYVVEKEVFWGYDSQEHLLGYLRGQDAVDREDHARWAHLRPSAVRPGS